jgi:two-component system, LytTR family, response regulator AlgR
MTKPMPAAAPALQVLVVDDEPLARQRMRTLLADLQAQVPHQIADELATATAALARIAHGPGIDVVLLDIHMPGMNGLVLAEALRAQRQPPAVVFVSAHAEHALKAFELQATDYLTKPVRLERLRQALQKCEQLRQLNRAQEADLPMSPDTRSDEPALIVVDRGRTQRVPLAQVLVLRAEQKYVTVVTAQQQLILDASLTDLEAQHPQWLLRVHRSALVNRRAMRSLHKATTDEGEGWVLQLAGLADAVPVSRRHVADVRQVLGQG